MKMAMIPRCILVITLVIQTSISEIQDAIPTTTDEPTTPVWTPTRNRGSIKYGMVIGPSEPQPFRRSPTTDVNLSALSQESSIPTEEDADFEETVLEVENYLRSHPELPELTREEIIDYIYNISEAKKDSSYESKKEQEAELKKTDSVMVVFPYKVENGENIEIHTNSPLVKEVSGEIGGGVEQEESPEDVTSTPKIVVYPVYKTTTEEFATTTDATIRSYTNYNDAEMVTKRYHFQETKNTSPGSNHKYEVTEEERVKSPIIVLPENKEASNKPKPFHLKETTVTDKPVYNDSSLEEFTFEAHSTPKPKKKRVKSRRKTTTTLPPPNLTKVLEILPPDMKDLLLSLDLNDTRVVADASNISDGSSSNSGTNTLQPTIDPLSYSAFKPLPGGRKNGIEDNMKDFLASFGLLADDEIKSKRSDKALHSPKPPKFIDSVPEVSLEIIPDDMRHVLHNLGLTRQPKNSRDHIFNPSNHSLNQSQEEVEKLKALMSSIKKIVSSNDSEPVSPGLQRVIIQQIHDLDNLTLKYKTRQSSQINDEIREIIKTNKNKFNFVPLDNITEGLSKKKFGEGPDPLSLAEGELKNEVKRQVSVSSSSSSSSDSSSTLLNDTTTEEPPNIEGLRASFGGGQTAPDDADVDSALPPKKPNGVYLLVDWNSFLEVGTEDDKRRVNIRFQPKVGDGRHFIPVTIP